MLCLVGTRHASAYTASSLTSCLRRTGCVSSHRSFGFLSSLFGAGGTGKRTDGGDGLPSKWRLKEVKEEVTSTVFFDVTVDGKPIGQVTMGLFGGVVPKTAENFRSLCVGDKGLSYKDSPFHRIVPGFMCQGGDFTKFDGTGGKSIYGEKFADEGFKFNHTKAGLLSMANVGPNTNGSQFFITTGAATWLDGKHVVFGKVLEGMEIVHYMENFGVPPAGKTSAKVMIADCGEVTVAAKGPEEASPSSNLLGTPASGTAGTVYNILKQGHGASVVKGSKVAVHATGVVQQTGEKFWSTKDAGEEVFCYTAGVGEVIRGWDQGMLGMQFQEERQLIIPAADGYDTAGFPAWGIPPNATLEFTLEVVGIEGQPMDQ